VVHRHTPAGTLDEVLEVPAQQVTACTFGGQ
jgi:sugar lactone lactonase YvrE